MEGNWKKHPTSKINTKEKTESNLTHRQNSDRFLRLTGREIQLFQRGLVPTLRSVPQPVLGTVTDVSPLPPLWFPGEMNSTNAFEKTLSLLQSSQNWASLSFVTSPHGRERSNVIHTPMASSGLNLISSLQCTQTETDNEGKSLFSRC